MKNVSRFLALLLALVMLMLPFAAFASDLSMDLQGLNKADYDKVLEYVLKGQFAEAANKIFTELKDIDTADALYEALNNLGVDYDLLSNAQLDQLLALLNQMRQQENAIPDDLPELDEVPLPINDFTKVARFKPPVTGSSALRMSAIAPYADENADGNNSGLVMNKTATDNEDGTYTIRMEVYATGEKTTSTVTEEIPTDVILVLDQSGSMDDNYEVITGYTYNQIQETYWYNEYYNSRLKEYSDAGNLFYKLPSGEYVPVTVTLENKTIVEALPNTTTNSEYWSYRDNLYQDADGNTPLTMTRSNGGNRQYIYYFANNTVNSRGANTVPTLNGRIIYRKYTVDVYTYTCVIDGVETVLSTSEGNNGKPTTANNADLILYTRTANTTSAGQKLAALKAAASSFVDDVKTKAAGADGTLGTADDVNHRIAVVGFASQSGYGDNTELLSISGWNSGSVGVAYDNITDQNLQDVLQSMNTSAGQTMVSNAISALAANGATRIDLGMDMANRILNANPVAAGEKRNRVVIVFTDGSPTDYNGFQLNVANDAINKAGTIKNVEGATVFAIGIFSGADATSAGTKPNNDLGQNSSQMAAACNWFMQSVSSNNGTPKSPSYYLTPEGQDGLNAIFKQISDQIETGGSSTKLTETSSVKDYLTPQFKLPAGVTEADITLETWKLTGVDANGNYTWSQNADAMGATAEIVKDADGNDGVTVTNFNFSENWCGKETTDGNVTYRGNKLVIQFVAELKDGFLGGDGVITNTGDSGIYDEKDEPVDKFPKPDVDVPTNAETIAIDANIFLGGYYKDTITPDNIKEKTVITIKGVRLDLTKPDYGLEDWQKDYIESIDVEITDGNGNTFTEIPQLEDDFTYTATITVKLKPNGDKQTTITKADHGTVYVFKPEVTYQDTTASIGDAIDYVTNNHVSTRWYSEGQKKYSDDQGVEMLKTATPPTLNLTYSPANEGTVGDTTHQVVNGDLPVQVSMVQIKIAETGETLDVTKDTTFIRKDCTVCGHLHGQVDTNGDTWTNFVIHVLNGDLKITKTGWSTLDPNQSFVFKVTGDGIEEALEVVIHGNGSVTIKDLPTGTYTVEEITDWSWRYKPDETVKPAKVEGKAEPTEVVFSNSRPNEKWLDGNAYCDNKWIDGSKDKSN